MEDWSASSLYH